MPTGREIREAVGMRRRWVVVGVTTADGAAGQVVDTVRFQMDPYSTQTYQGDFIRFTSGSLAGKVARVVRLDPTTGTFYISPQLTVPAGTRYEVWEYFINPDDVDRARDEALTTLCSTWRPQPITLVPDGDLMEPTVASWSVQDASLAKVTPSGPFRFGDKALRVTNTAANGRAISAAFPARRAQRLFVYVPVRPVQGTARVRFLDGSGQELALTGMGARDVSGDGSVSAIWGWSQVPSDGTVALHLIGLEPNAIIEWGPINCHIVLQTRLVLPDRIRSRKRVAPGFSLLPITFQVQYVGNPQMAYGVHMERRQAGTNVELIFQPALGPDRPYFYYERSFYSRLQNDYVQESDRATGDAATTTCPLEYAVAGTTFILAGMKMLENPEDRVWLAAQQEAARLLNIYEREFGAEPRFVEEEPNFYAVPQAMI